MCTLLPPTPPPHTHIHGETFLKTLLTKNRLNWRKMIVEGSYEVKMAHATNILSLPHLYYMFRLEESLPAQIFN